mmetsp:Transcript_16418/g.24128  ORF Transcript_16418/g.24128 Transcript_16418/m.24128 type:complete len:251 (-) Transcript_16418:312-1064(-)
MTHSMLSKTLIWSLIATSHAFAPPAAFKTYSKAGGTVLSATPDFFLQSSTLLSDADSLTADILSSDAVSDTVSSVAAETSASEAITAAAADAVSTITEPVAAAVVESGLNLDVVTLVLGQENYGLAIVAVGEAIWSFLEAPSLDHAKILIPAVVAAAVLCLVSGPMVTSGDLASVGLGLEIATAVSVLLGASYVARLVAPFSPSAKEIAFLGLLVSIAGFFSFTQNLVVDGFVTLPSIPLPTLPTIELPF